jgi:hypothetical protein
MLPLDPVPTSLRYVWVGVVVVGVTERRCSAATMMQLGDEVDDDGENGRRRITTADARDAPRHPSALLPSWLQPFVQIYSYPFARCLAHLTASHLQAPSIPRRCCLISDVSPPYVTVCPRIGHPINAIGSPQSRLKHSWPLASQLLDKYFARPCGGSSSFLVHYLTL